MAKRLLIMALVAVQSASWSGASLFLCISADGSFCIDGGAESCTCCVDEHDRNACCEDHAACCSHDACDAEDSQAVLLKGDPCGCTHLQISQSQAPMVVARTVLNSRDERAAAFVALVPVACGAPHLCRDVEGSPPGGGPPFGPSLALMTVAVAVRTC